MRYQRPLLAAIVAAAIPTWCGATIVPAGRGLTPHRATSPLRGAHSWMSPQAKSARQLLYVANGSTGVVDVFSVTKKGTKLTGQIAGFQSPQGMTVDAAGTLYVVNDYIPQEGPVGGEVDIFPKGATNPSIIIGDYPWVPFDVGVDKKGDVYVANIAPITQFSPGSVTVFDKAGKGPIRTLKGASLGEAYGITVDQRTSDVYVSYTQNLGGGGRIATFAGGRGKAQDLGVSYGTPWGIIQDAAGNLLASDGNGPIHIYPQAGGSQIGAINVPGDPLFATFNSDRSLLYVSNFNNFDVEIFRYSDGTMVGSVTDSQWGKNEWPTGVAFWPPAK
jgi:hypothetical protein